MSDQVPADLGSQLKEALWKAPPEGSRERVWDQIVDAVPGAEGGGAIEAGGSGGVAGARREQTRRTVAVIAIAAAVALIAGIALVLLSSPDPAVVPATNQSLVLLSSAERTLDEASAAAGAGEFGTANDLLEKYAVEMEEVENAAENDEEVAEALDEAAGRHAAKLDEVAAKVPEVARNTGLARAREVQARNAQRKAERAKARAEKQQNGEPDSGKGKGKGNGGNKGEGHDKTGKGDDFHENGESPQSVPESQGDQGGSGTFEPAG